MHLRARHGLVASILLLQCTLIPEVATADAASGGGWSAVRLDVEVRVDPGGQRLETQGVLTLELRSRESSFGPVLLLSTQQTSDGVPAIAFNAVSCPGAETVVASEPFQERWQQAIVRFHSPRRRGDTIAVRFSCHSTGAVRRMIVHPDAAMADWINGWLPFPLPDGDGTIGLVPSNFRVGGKTTLRMPRGWSGLVDGERITRQELKTEVVETWDTPPGVARSFVAGPYVTASKRVGGRVIRVYVLDSSQAERADALAQRLGLAISAIEQKLGPLPVRGPYSVVEFPRIPLQSFGAVSEQSFVAIQPPNVEYAFENLQLLAHEASHAWWGNFIGTSGSGTKWCSESLAEYCAVIAIESTEGVQAARDFLDFARPGTDPYYSAAGYFALVRAGQDQPIASMGTGEGTHALANSKGVWVLHMLRQLVGSERFFAVLRDVVRDRAGQDITADTLRRRFASAAPGLDVRGFFAQWLDRTGAPILRTDWHASFGGDGLILRLAQLQEGEPFEADLEVGVTLEDGTTVLRTVSMDAADHVFEIETGGRPVSVALDPNRKLLLWRPSYGPPPVGEILPASAIASEALRQQVVGRYRFDGFEKDVEVFVRGDILYMQPAGSAPSRLVLDHGGVFQVDAPGGMMVEFDLSAKPSPGLVSIEGGGRERYPARRLKDGKD